VRIDDEREMSLVAMESLLLEDVSPYDGARTERD